jgi:hypothetical protein
MHKKDLVKDLAQRLKLSTADLLHKLASLLAIQSTSDVWVSVVIVVLQLRFGILLAVHE